MGFGEKGSTVPPPLSSPELLSPQATAPLQMWKGRRAARTAGPGLSAPHTGVLTNHQNSVRLMPFIPSLLMRTLRREVTWLAPGHTARQEWSWDLNLKVWLQSPYSIPVHCPAWQDAAAAGEEDAIKHALCGRHLLWIPCVINSHD